MIKDRQDTVQNNQNVEKYLKSEYALEYLKLCAFLKERVEEDKLNDVMQDILVLLYDAQKESRVPESIYGDDIESFCKKISEGLPHEKKIRINKKRKTVMKYRIAIGILCFGIIGVMIYNKLSLNGTIGVLKNGLAFMVQNNDYNVEFENTSTFYEVEVDLSNLESNIGKVIYDDGQCIIDIDHIVKENNGVYNVFFRTHGRYNRHGGTLVTPIYKSSLNDTKYSIVEYHLIDGTSYSGFTAQEKPIKEENISDVMVGKMQVLLDGMPYACSLSTFDSLKYKDGDIFGFYLFTVDNNEKEKDEVLLKDKIAEAKGRVTLRLYDLIKTTWERDVIE